MKRAMIFIIATAFLWLSDGIAHSDELTFSDDFERTDIGGDWITGAFCDSDTITIVGGRVEATENCNFIETVQEFSGNLRIEVDVEKVGSSDHGCWDFGVLLTELNEYSGIILFDSGGVDGIAIGNEPGSGCGYDVTIPSGVNRGKAIFIYQDGTVGFSFENDDGEIIDAGSVYAGNYDSSRIRIHLAAHLDTPRYVDNVKVYSLPGQPNLRDQGQIFGTGGTLALETEEWSQSITTGISGQLTEIVIQFHYGVPAQPPALNLSIFDGGNPISGSALFSEQLFITSADLHDENLFTWDLRRAGLFFNVGDSFCLVLQADGVGYEIAGNDPPGYDGGELFRNRVEFLGLSDIAFITYVDPMMTVEVSVDIKPGSYPNSINLKSKGKVPVAILTTIDFDAYDVDPVSCEFAGAYPLRWNMEDVDHDGDRDMLFHFMTQELDMTKESTEATMECETFEGIQITGTDSVNIVPKGNMHSKKAKKK